MWAPNTIRKRRANHGPHPDIPPASWAILAFAHPTSPFYRGRLASQRCLTHV
jgi:hypothetical protein